VLRADSQPLLRLNVGVGPMAPCDEAAEAVGAMVGDPIDSVGTIAEELAEVVGAMAAAGIEGAAGLGARPVTMGAISCVADARCRGDDVRVVTIGPLLGLITGTGSDPAVAAEATSL